MLLEMGRVVQLFSLYMVSYFLTKAEPTEMIVHDVQYVQSNLSQGGCALKETTIHKSKYRYRNLRNLGYSYQFY